MKKYEIRRMAAVYSDRSWWHVVDIPCNRIVLKSSYYFDRAKRNRESLAFSRATGIPIKKDSQKPVTSP